MEDCVTAKKEHLATLRKGVEHWNSWYQEYCDTQTGFRARLWYQSPDLSDWDGSFLREFDWQRFCYQRLGHHSELEEAHERYEQGMLSSSEIEEGWVELSGVKLLHANMQRVDLSRIRLRGAFLDYADLRYSNLTSAVLDNAHLKGTKLASTSLTNVSLVNCNLQSADLSQCNLSGATLEGADLTHANLERVNLRGANLRRAILVETNLEGADLTDCEVYGISAWEVRLKGTRQHDLRITLPDQPEITVDNLEVAQFVYLLLRREKLRNIIETITSKTVLILGRFTPERKAILDALADEVRLHKLIPMIFDFERSTNRDLTETINVLAGLSLFVIADVTNPKSSPLELQATVPDYQIPFIIIIQEAEKPFAMVDGLKKYDWVLDPILTYRSAESLRRAFKKAVLDRAWEKHKELNSRKAIGMAARSIEDFLGHGADA